MERMLIKHLSGSKANQVEEFALKHHNDLTFGRDASATVKYDPDRDDLVGREHARIARNPNNPNGFTLSDLNSKNGTFLNGQRITGTVDLGIGDRVQFGPGGPEFTFDVEPRPENFAKATRISEAGTATPATRISETATATAAGAGTRAGGVGKATVERMISETASETRREQGRKYGMIGAIAGLLLLLVIGAVAAGGYYLYTQRQAAEEGLRGELSNKSDEIQRKIADDKAAAPLRADEIAEKYKKSVVQVEAAWHLRHPLRQTQVYHLHLPQVLAMKIQTRDVAFKAVIVGPAIPVYVQTNDLKSYEPVLVEDKGPGNINEPIGGVLTGSGFFVTTNGFILTNKHVASSWQGTYGFPSDTPNGIVISPDGNWIVAAGVRPPNDWVPSNTVTAGGTIGALNMRFSSAADYEGINDYLRVALPGREGRINAILNQAAPRHDAALIKIEAPGELSKVELFDNYDELKKGESVVVMGYPAMTANQYGVIPSQNMFDRTTKLTPIANPSVTVTSVSNILRSNTKDQDRMVISQIGDVIQLATGSTGPGNSGGPVFDMQGRVIGIYFAYSTLGDIQYAVPIRYGKEIMNVD